MTCVLFGPKQNIKYINELQLFFFIHLVWKTSLCWKFRKRKDKNNSYNPWTLLQINSEDSLDLGFFFLQLWTENLIINWLYYYKCTFFWIWERKIKVKQSWAKKTVPALLEALTVLGGWPEARCLFTPTIRKKVSAKETSALDLVWLCQLSFKSCI